VTAHPNTAASLYKMASPREIAAAIASCGRLHESRRGDLFTTDRRGDLCIPANAPWPSASPKPSTVEPDASLLLRHEYTASARPAGCLAPPNT
jgi:hypothetical protein